MTQYRSELSPDWEAPRGRSRWVRRACLAVLVVAGLSGAVWIARGGINDSGDRALPVEALPTADSSPAGDAVPDELAPVGAWRQMAEAPHRRPLRSRGGVDRNVPRRPWRARVR